MLLSIKDDGVGFDLESLRKRAPRAATLGLISMQERAHAAGGTIEITPHVPKAPRSASALTLSPDKAALTNKFVHPLLNRLYRSVMISRMRLGIFNEPTILDQRQDLAERRQEAAAAWRIAAPARTGSDEPVMPGAICSCRLAPRRRRCCRRAPEPDRGRDEKPNRSSQNGKTEHDQGKTDQPSQRAEAA